MASDRDRRQKRLETFRSLLSERIAKLNVLWIQLEQAVGDADTANQIRGTLHTIKGEAALLRFRGVADVAHGLEDLIERVAADAGPPVMEFGQLVLDAFDLIETLAARDPDQGTPEVAAMLASLAGAHGAPTAAGAVADGVAPTSRAEEEVIDSGGGEADAVPEPIAPGGDSAALLAALVSDSQPRSRSTYSVRVRPEQLDRMRGIIAELLQARSRLALGASALHEQRYKVSKPGQLDQPDVVAAAGGSGVGLGVALAVAPRDQPGDDVLRSIEAQLRENVIRISTLITALDEVTRELRMVPISVLFDRYPRAVRTMSRELGRQVRLRSYGDVMEADRDVLEALDAPILHLVRNALDHGIEPPETRRAAGKPEVGALDLRARVASDTLHVEVADDGAGVDLAAIRRRAVAIGLADAGTADELSESQLLQCLFHPGMSTRGTVTSMSGRGIGLDVVYKTVRNLGGSVEVRSVRGEGCVFHLAVPIRAAITSVLLFRVGRGWYALPSSDLVGLVESDELERAERLDGPAVSYEGELVPVIGLEPVLGEQAPSFADARRSAGRIIIARAGERLVALTDSHSHSQREAILESVGAVMGEGTLVSAGFGLEDGSVAMTLDVGAVIAAAKGAPRLAPELVVGAGPAGESGPTPAPLVLVAEDSPVIRDLIVEALRTHGLRVVEAADGREAVNRLDENPDIALVVTDIEMPRLDGLGLITELRSRPGRRIPAVVVSTRGSDEDKLAAVAVGADAYLVKSAFSRTGLWSIVSRFLG
ncbi:hybrid sensor histidine kinase/response regulator [Haliangium sp.]|uniref:hybrid sensor histidine kinase/response regulator n=1 Tax=Haliangium sp. TaxID=2663208 RepID=UPI003D0ED1C9